MWSAAEYSGGLWALPVCASVGRANILPPHISRMSATSSGRMEAAVDINRPGVAGSFHKQRCKGNHALLDLRGGGKDIKSPSAFLRTPLLCIVGE